MPIKHTLKLGSLFSGIGGFDRGLMSPVSWQVEQDKDCNRVLAHHWPDVQRFNDVKEVGKANLCPVDLICGGFPCQDLSVAGKRAGLDGERSGLWFEFHRIIRELSPQWVLIENVPGLLSSNGGRDFAVILSGLGELGYMSAWRVLDAQYFGVPQRRRRVFIVASLRNGSCAEVLFESSCGCGNPAPGREAGEGVAGAISGGSADSRRGFRNDLDGHGAYICRETAGALSASGRGTSRTGESRGQDPLIVTPTYVAQVTGPLTVGHHDCAGHPHRMGDTSFLIGDVKEIFPTLRGFGHGWQGQHNDDMAKAMLVRRLTPTECLRLQGFPDNWLDLTTPLSDSAKYRMTGNAVAVPVIEWIGKRILEAINAD